MGLDIELIKHRLNASTGAIAIDSPNSVEDELLTKLVLEVAEPLEYQPFYWNLAKGLQSLSITRQRQSGVSRHWFRWIRKAECFHKYGLEGITN